MHTILGLGLWLLLAGTASGFAGCSGDDPEPAAGSGGTGGASQDAGTEAAAGQAGEAGQAGAAGQAGQAGQAGSAGDGGEGQVGLADPKQAKIHGKSTSEWAEAYWKWMMTGGNADSADQGDAYFMPLPDAKDLDENDDNNILTGHLDLKVPAGKPIVLPIMAWMTERYEADSGTPDDEPAHDACFNPRLDPRQCEGAVKGEAAWAYVTLDGKQVMVNQDQFYTGYQKWATPLQYPEATEYGSVAAIGSQTVLVVIEPLAAGTHNVTNYVDFGPFGFFFDNSWTLTVEDKGGTPVPAGPMADESRPALESGIADPSQLVAGKSLSHWYGAYFRWLMTGADEAQAMASEVAFLPMPAYNDIDSSEDAVWSQGHVDVTLPAGKPFILPVEAWVLESYVADAGIPNDEPMPNACHDPVLDPRLCEFGPRKFNTARVYLTLDGKQILADQSRFYLPPQPFDPVIEYPEPTDYGANAAVAVQGIGFITEPLAAGTHELKLFVDLGFLGHFIYDNSWTITVQ
jgi:hypothetical protein